ncbi:porin [Benzoatithermus flavus]|uniref:Porin n=1 Tax=Benzoatithermus flavus TaxID=3108223 RepID=A0ABU8XP90_9PROT
MTLRKILLGTTAVLGAGLMTAAVPSVAGAAEVKPGGYPDLTLTGFARFRMHGGQLDDARLNNAFSRDLDFSNDTEVHVVARAKDERTGLEYGGTVEFEADTNRADNTDESWIFVRGGFGEVRLGDEDGASDTSAVGAQTIAAGTGGIDGSVIDTFAGGATFKLDNTNDATKIRYYTPSFGGFQIGVSYTPQQAALSSGAGNGDSLAGKAVTAQNFVEAAALYKGSLGGVGVLASITGAVCDWKAAGDDDCSGIYGGANVDLFGFKLGGGYGTEKFGALEKSFYNIGIGAALGPTNVSINYGKVVDSDNLTFNGVAVDKPSNLVFSADIALMPGLVLAGDVGFFDNDVEGGAERSGWQAVGRLGLAF